MSFYCKMMNTKGEEIPVQALRVPECWGYHIPRPSAQEFFEVFSLTHRPPLLTRKYSWLSRTQSHCAAGMIKSMKNFHGHLRGIKAATFRL